MDEPPGLCLQQAIEQYVDREKWQALCNAVARKIRHLHRHDDRDLRYIPVSEWGDFDQPRQPVEVIVAIKRAERLVMDDFWDQLRRGKLIATGIVCPPRIDSKREEIPRHLFRILQGRIVESSFVGPDIKIVDVLVRPASECGPVLEHDKPVASLRPVTTLVDANDYLETEIKTSNHGRRGRPPLPSDYERELRRRAEAGELCELLEHEALRLYNWGDRQGLRNSAGKPWPIGTIKNKLRGVYRNLKAQKSSPK